MKGFLKMSVKFEQVWEQAQQLSEAELTKLQDNVTQYLQAKKIAKPENQPEQQEQPKERWVVIPGAYRLTPEQVQARMEKLFGAERLARIGRIDISKLPQGEKSLSEMINEDREDRF